MSPSIVLLYSILWYLIYTSKKHKEVYLFLNISTIYFHIKLPFFKNNCFFFTALLFLFLMAMMLQPLQTNFHKFCLVVCRARWQLGRKIEAGSQSTKASRAHKNNFVKSDNGIFVGTRL